ncbi:glycoside hydrolase family 20 [Arenibacter sp. TNZ]|jgi:hexosaminidase|uniref:beta-N-acetylhexosaminidase n=1 Tax=Arenibacter TaxID=178469 RepID=UPI000CD42FB0|nr:MULTISPECIES: beta-N-acetylhexosaminidase [Arenibacter]MCM4173352.1 glycoside hydrolase family 20 [Arenibacter sp. TNZ]
MKNIIIILPVVLLWALSGIAQNTGIIPQPLRVDMEEWEFIITSNTPIIADRPNQENASYLQELLKVEYKKELQIKRKGGKGIILNLNPSLAQKLGKEGYTLKVGKSAISISAGTTTGVFYGIISLRQLIRTVEDGKNRNLSISGMSIEDRPRFSWRAFMLDEGRYFKGTEQVKKLLDQMSLLKMNVFHWHLTDDQGWRLEIKKYPKLTQVGSNRSNSQIGGWDSAERSNTPHSGYYTQEEIKDIIAYANERQITIIPEIEMPGHASAAIAAYPWLGTIGDLNEVPTVFGKLPDSFNVSDPRVYEFLENVLLEVMELFPGNIIHIGGDEVKFDAWKSSVEIQNFMLENGLISPADLHIFFTNRISNYLNKNGHRMMGWNEILGENVHEWQETTDIEVKENLAKNTLVHFWKGNLDLVSKAVREGYEIVNSYHEYTYLDYSYKSIPLEKAYSFDPIPEGLEEKLHNKVIGSGCQMWGEWIPDTIDMDKMVFPRLAAYAEVGWTSKTRKDYPVFRANLNRLLVGWKDRGFTLPEKFEKEDFKENR